MLQCVGCVWVIAKRVKARQQVDIKLPRPCPDPLTGNDELGTAACAAEEWGTAMTAGWVKGSE